MVGGRQAIWRKTPSESLLCAACCDPAAHGTIRSPLQAKDTTQDLNAHPRSLREQVRRLGGGPSLTCIRHGAHYAHTHTDSGRRTRRGFLCGREAGRLVRHESRRQAMARVAGHLSVEDLEAGFRSARDPTAARHFQVIWLLARGHTIADVAAVTSFVPRWIEQLLARYNAHGPEALGDLRRRNGSAPSVLRPELLARLPERLATPPPDGGLWSSRKVAAWMAGELGLAAVLPQCGWEALKAIDWSVQKPRPRHPAAATPEKREAFKKSWSRPSLRSGRSTRASRSRSGPRTSTALA